MADTLNEELTPQPITSGREASELASFSQLHLSFGWWSLLVFLSLGIILETLHGFKIRSYLDVSNETRRLMWTLAHAHGTLISLIHLSFSSMLLRLKARNQNSVRTASICLIGTSLLMPTGFFLGGLFIHAGDPGLGVMLVPIGAFLLLVGVFLIAREADRLRMPLPKVSREDPAAPPAARLEKPRKGPAVRPKQPKRSAL